MSQDNPDSDPLAFRVRVGQIRYDVNWQGTAIKMQQERLAAYVQMPIEQRMYTHMRAVVDLDFLVISARRLLRVAEQTKSLRVDTGELKQSIKIFTSRWLPQLVDIRNALEHLDHGTVGIVPMQGGETIAFLWPGGQLDALKLCNASAQLCRAIVKAIEPFEE